MPAIDVFAAAASPANTIESCNRAIALAADRDHPLLVLLGEIEPTSEAAGLLLDAIDTDPMIGFAVARLTGSRDDSVRRLAFGGDPSIDELPRRLLSEMPDTYLVADLPARCVLIKPLVLANFGALDPRFRTLAAALWHYMARARRCGFRTLICNRAVAPTREMRSPSASIVPFRSLPESDRMLLRELVPNFDRTREEFGVEWLAAAETRLARAVPRAYGTQPSLLLDVRNVNPGMNGTAVAALGVCGGLHALDIEWDVTLLASRDACAFHKLDELFPKWQVRTKLTSRQFTAALRLSQPWHIQEMIDLHAVAAYNLYLFLDTISWDIAYTAPGHLDGTWRFMADHADGILFISQFTRDRFQRRFTPKTETPSLVSYLSFNPADYVHPDVQHSVDDAGIFVVGNGYDHKDVQPTVDLLTTAFPYESIVALGATNAATPRVRTLESGTLSELDMHRLYAGARVVVFPSFYEGFGLPILTSLAYGRTVVARRSALLDEIAAQCAPHGRLAAFDRREDLVELIGRILHGEDVPQLSLGSALRDRGPTSWQDVAGNIERFLTALVSDLSRSRWRSREHAIRQLLAAPVSLVEKAVKAPMRAD